MSRIAVLVKQVPDPSLVTVSPQGTLLREGVPSMLDPFGRMALMLALKMRDEIGGTVTAISMGPKQAEEVLRKCLEFGADDAVLMTDRRFAGSDTMATARALAALISKEGYDLVLCGMQATDGDTAQVPPELATLLGYRIYSYVSEARFGDSITLIQTYERYEQDSLLETPAVLSVCRTPEGSPQLPSLKDFVRASKAEIRTVTLDDLQLPERMTGLKGSETKVTKVETYMRETIRTERIDGSDPSHAADIILREVKG